MDKEIKLVNNVEGSVVSDKLLNRLDTPNAQAEQIGILKGELRVAEELMDRVLLDQQRELEEATKQVQVILAKEPKTRSVYTNPWEDMLYNISGGNVKEVTTVNIDKLSELADAIVKGDAKKEIEEMQQKLEKQKKEVEAADNRVKSIKEQMKQLEEATTERVSSAIERAERVNLRKIDDLTQEVKALQKENDLQLSKQDNLERERDLLIEAHQTEVNLLKKKINMLETPVKGVLDKAKNKFNDWAFRRQMKKIS
jgi:HAMP domain-containing protein